jgi:hypothetical protein
MSPKSILGVIALTIWMAAGIAPADAQTPSCSPGYYVASDGRCYPGSPPVDPPPTDTAPPINRPPVVFNGPDFGFGYGRYDEVDRNESDLRR